MINHVIQIEIQFLLNVFPQPSPGEGGNMAKKGFGGGRKKIKMCALKMVILQLCCVCMRSFKCNFILVEGEKHEFQKSYRNRDRNFSM